MKKLRIIPRLDIKGSNLVKGINYEGLRVLGNPDNFSKFYFDIGADEIIYHDVMASLHKRNTVLETISKTVKDVFVPITVGGGLKTISDIANVLESGADKIFINSEAVKNKNFIKESVKLFGSSTIVICIETANIEGQFYPFIDNAREFVNKKTIDWISEVQDYGVGEILLSSIDRDGTGQGYDKDLMESYVDRSLKNLGVETIDLLQMHCPPTEVFSNDLTYQMLDYLVSKGKIQHYGFSVETVDEAMNCIQKPHTKSVQIIFNMFRLKPAEEFFKLAKEKNIAIIARVPLASGLLTGKMHSKSTFPDNDHRNYNINGNAFDIGETFSGVDFSKALEVVEELKSLTPDGFSLSQLALKWILMHDEVSVVIPGAKNSDQALKNISASALPDIPNLMEKIETIYNTHLKNDIHPRW